MEAKYSRGCLLEQIKHEHLEATGKWCGTENGHQIVGNETKSIISVLKSQAL